MKSIKRIYVGAVLAGIIIVGTAVPANANIITYDVSWTGTLGNTMSGVFSYDDADAVDGFVRDRDSDLISLALTSTDYGLSWIWPGDPTDPFNFNFIVATETLPLTGAAGSTEAQFWNGAGVGIGLGYQGSDGRSGLLIDGSFREATASLVLNKRPDSVPESGSTLAMLGLVAAGLMGVRRRK